MIHVFQVDSTRILHDKPGQAKFINERSIEVTMCIVLLTNCYAAIIEILPALKKAMFQIHFVGVGLQVL